MKKSFLLLSLSTIAYYTTTAQKLALNVSNGQKFTIVNSCKVINTTEAMGQSMETNVELNSTSIANVTNVNSSSFDITETVTKMKSNMSMMGQEMNYDSEKKDNDERAEEALKGTLNVPKAYTIGNDGAVISEPKAGDKEGEVNPMAMLTAGGLASNSLSIYIPNVLNKDLTVGYTWQDSSATKGKMNSKIVNNFKVINIENGVVTLENNATQNINGTMEQMGQEMSMSGVNTIKALHKVNQKTGVLILTTTEIVSKTNIEAMGMTIPSNGTISCKIEVTAN